MNISSSQIKSTQQCAVVTGLILAIKQLVGLSLLCDVAIASCQTANVSSSQLTSVQNLVWFQLQMSNAPVM